MRSLDHASDHVVADAESHRQQDHGGGFYCDDDLFFHCVLQLSPPKGGVLVGKFYFAEFQAVIG